MFLQLFIVYSCVQWKKYLDENTVHKQINTYKYGMSSIFWFDFFFDLR